MPHSTSQFSPPGTQTRHQTSNPPDHRLQAELLLQPNGKLATSSSTTTPPPPPLGPGFQNDLNSDFTLLHAAISTHHEDWTHSPTTTPQLDIDLKHSTGRLLRITLHSASNEGLALRYTYDAANPQPLQLHGEQTEFHPDHTTPAYEEHGTTTTAIP